MMWWGWAILLVEMFLHEYEQCVLESINFKGDDYGL